MPMWPLADVIGVSNGSAYYVLIALVKKGFMKIENLKITLAECNMLIF